MLGSESVFLFVCFFFMMTIWMANIRVCIETSILINSDLFSPYPKKRGKNHLF